MRTEAIEKVDIEAALRLMTTENELVLRVMIATGLRVGDVLGLKAAHLDGGSVTIKEQKTGKKRRLRLPQDLRRQLQRIAGEVYVFEHRDDKKRHRTRQAVWKDIKQAADKMRVPYNVGTHSARKRWALNCLDRGYDVYDLQRLMNHSTPEITMIYCIANQVHRKKKKSYRDGKTMTKG